MEVLERLGRYFCPVGGANPGGWPKEPPNYLGFRYRGRLQAIHHVEGYAVRLAPWERIPELAGRVEVPEHDQFDFELGPAIHPEHVVRTGNLFRAQRVWCALDLLLTSETIARRATRRRSAWRTLARSEPEVTGRRPDPYHPRCGWRCGGGEMAETGRSTRVRQQVEKWRDELLDLTGRNKLLRFRPSKMTLEVELPRPQVLVDRLMTGRSRYWSVFLPADGMPGEEASEAESESAEAAAAAGSDPASTLYTQKETSKEVLSACASLARRSKQEFMDRGVWILYLGIGMLRWSDPADRSEAELDSPLLLFPVDLVAEKGREGWRIEPAENEVVVNPALWLKLESELDIKLPEVGDDDSLDVSGSWLPSDMRSPDTQNGPSASAPCSRSFLSTRRPCTATCATTWTTSSSTRSSRLSRATRANPQTRSPTSRSTRCRSRRSTTGRPLSTR